MLNVEVTDLTVTLEEFSPVLRYDLYETVSYLNPLFLRLHQFYFTTPRRGLGLRWLCVTFRFWGYRRPTAAAPLAIWVLYLHATFCGVSIEVEPKLVGYNYLVDVTPA